MVEESNSFI